MPKEQYTDQGKLLWHYAKLAGWTEARLTALLLKQFSVTHANALTQQQMRAALAMMKSYVAKAEKAHSAKLRQMIMALVSKNHQTLEWLHQMMEAWGYGDSLRRLNYTQTIQVWDAVRSCFRSDKSMAPEVK